MKSLRGANALLRSTNALTRSSSISAANSTRLQTLPPRNQLVCARPFSQSPQLAKKKQQQKEEEPSHGKKSKGSSSPAPAPSTKASSSSSASSSKPSSGSSSPDGRPQADPEDPFNLSDLSFAFDKAEKHYTEELKSLRSAGKLVGEAISSLPVALKSGSSSTTETFPLRDVATVTPVGGAGGVVRKWSIVAYEQASVKGIMSAVQRSEQFNQQPQKNEENPLELTLTVEPERADALTKRAKEACQAWRTKIRDESHKRETLHKKWKTDGHLLPDDVKKLKEKVQKLQDDKMKVVQQKEKEVLQAIMSKAG
ncbi:ribosome recycling factor-domain-containing protein [Diplogelasinospora grovesii]|uniref:Ribosome recycling factor-domain-containing protein n=1 Tax=Diplogelasinospora grovesii TaxID=303347 RepID=A0AAN6N6F0_9PEZI|nr:ribosome recycling factor-domain-containing protein [Diplogelasinospora grovesii]